jgi:hypothetical protein
MYNDANTLIKALIVTCSQRKAKVHCKGFWGLDNSEAVSKDATQTPNYQMNTPTPVNEQAK